MSDARQEMIVKSNRLVEAKMPMSKLGHRIVALLIAQLDRSSEHFGFQKLPVKELNDRCGIRGRDVYDRAPSICNDLLDTKLMIKKEKAGGGYKYRGINLMDECRYETGDAYIEAKFNERMKPYLLRLKERFTMYEAKYFLPLSSKHSMRIYELLKMREGISILRISVQEFREILGLTESYDSFSHLKRYVIEKARSEVTEKTDIHFTYDVEREGRTAKRLKFFIHASESNNPQPKMEDRTSAPNIDVIDVFLAELTQEQIDKIDKEALQTLHDKAATYARKENPDASRSMIQSITLRRMKDIWTSARESD